MLLTCDAFFSEKKYLKKQKTCHFKTNICKLMKITED